MSTLYISDLDGTLLGPDARLSDETVATLNRLLDAGMLFTVATSRTPATVIDLLSRLHLRLPAVLMAGTLLYDIPTRRALAITCFPDEVAASVCRALQNEDKEALLYVVRGEKMFVYYRELTGEFERTFVAERRHSPYKTFTQTQNYAQSILGGQLMRALLCLEDEADARRWFSIFDEMPGVLCYLYPNEYGAGFTVEAYPDGCDKATGLAAVRSLCGARRVVAFGDNLNDLPLFAASDESCAVGNAVPAVRKNASCVIGSNADSGVARWLARHAGGEGSLAAD